jgi:hypothetical protein
MKQTELAVQPAEQQYEEGTVLDLLRAIFHLKIARYHIKMIQENNPLGIDEDKMADTDRVLLTLIREIKKKTYVLQGYEWTDADQSVSPEKLFMISTIAEIIAKIGCKESNRYLEEFTDLVVSLLNEVFYYEQIRKRIFFGKYKALFKMIETELRADANHQANTPFEGQINYKDKSLWIKLPSFQSPSQIQE